MRRRDFFGNMFKLGLGAVFYGSRALPRFWGEKGGPPRVERGREGEDLRERLQRELENVHLRAQKAGVDFPSLVPDDVLVLMRDQEEAGQEEAFIHVWEKQAQKTLEHLTFQDAYRTYSVEGEPMTVKMARVLPRELLVASAMTRNPELKKLCWKVIRDYCEWNRRNAFTQLDENRIFLHEWRKQNEIHSLDERNRARVLEARDQRIRDLQSRGTDEGRKAAADLESKKNVIDRAYPMNQWETFHNFLMGLSCVWNSFDEVDRESYRQLIFGFVQFWQSKRQEFAGLLARYYSNRGDRISDQAAPDDTIARPVGFACDCSVILERMGERVASVAFQRFARELMDSSDEAFWRVQQRVNAGHADIYALAERRFPQKTVGQLTPQEARELRTTILEKNAASWDVPGDGVRVAIARVSLVRSMLLNQAERGSDAGEVIADQLTKAIDELEVFMAIASQKTPVIFLAREGDIKSALRDIPSEYRIDPGETLCLSSVFQSPDDKLPVRYFISGGHESGNLEWFAAFGALWELSSKHGNLLGKYFPQLNGLRERLKHFQEKSELFLKEVVDSAVRLNQNPSFTHRSEPERIAQLARNLAQCARVVGISRNGRIGSVVRVHPNAHVILPVE